MTTTVEKARVRADDRLRHRQFVDGMAFDMKRSRLEGGPFDDDCGQVIVAQTSADLRLPGPSCERHANAC